MLTTVGLPKEEMGKFALYLLLDRMKGGHSGVVRMELSGHLMIGTAAPTFPRAPGAITVYKKFFIKEEAYVYWND